MGRLFLAIAVASLLVPQKSFAWGDEGHSIVALIAERVLEQEAEGKPRSVAAKTLATLREILGDTKIDKASEWADDVKTLARNCTKPPYVKDPNWGRDDRKGTSSAICDAYKYTSSWHFINTDQTQYVLNPTSPDYFKGDMIVMIIGLSQVLKGQKADVLNGVGSYANWKKECLKKQNANCKKEALQYLIHLVGDVHQPLHAGAPCDIGANTQLVTFFGEEIDKGAWWCNANSPDHCKHHELHQAWDKNLLMRGDYTKNEPYVEKLLKKMAKVEQSSDEKACVKTAPDKPIKIDGKNGAIDWVNESLCYVQQAYEFPDDRTVGKNAKGAREVAQTKNVVPNRCRADKEVGQGRDRHFAPLAIGEKYLKANLPTIDERLYWGGVRLATLLKDIYGKGDRVADFK